MTDFLDEKRQQIADRLKELKPLVDEHNPSRPPLRHSQSWEHRLPPPRLLPLPPPPRPRLLAADRDARVEAPTVRAEQPQQPPQRPLRPPPRSKLHAKNQAVLRAAKK